MYPFEDRILHPSLEQRMVRYNFSIELVVVV
jgi:hypothetical protein